MSHAVCAIAGHRVEASKLSSGRINVGIDGTLVGVSQDLSCAIEEIKESLRMRHPHDPAPAIPASFIDKLSGIRDDILAVIRDGSRIDRYLEITCTDDPPCVLFLTTANHDQTQYRVPASFDMTADDEEECADEILSQARAYLMANA